MTATRPLAALHPTNGHPATLGGLLGLLLFFVLMASGCVSPAAAPATGIAGGDMTPAQAHAIDSLKSVQDAAWAAKDATAYANSYATDADFVNPIGGVVPGREGIRADHAFLFGGPFAGSTSTSVIRRGVFLADTVVLVDFDVDLTGYRSLPPELHETEPGVLRARDKWIVAKRGGTWEILARQLTEVAPAL